ncbi:MAG: polysaccharide deacetylase family protein [Bacteroidia bacterium]
MLIYAENITPRLTYTLDFIFKEVIGVDYFLTDDKVSFAQSTSQPKICYDNDNLGGIYIEPKKILSESSIFPRIIEKGKWNNLPTIFRNDAGDVPFDFFSAVFFLITRYEEYIDKEKDEHGRYIASHSIAHKYGFLNKPIINLWCEQFAKEFLGITKLKDQFSSIVTFDIDNSYAYHGKGFKRFVLSTLRDVFQLKFKALLVRFASLFNIEKDPCNTYNYIFESFKKHNVQRSIFFFLNGAYSRMDKNLPISSSLQQALIQQCKTHAEIGIHPSYVSNSKPTFQREISSLEKVVGQPVIKSRQHFLMLAFPRTYQQLVSNNIAQDFTLGYPETVGFRASTCTPFYWFDLSKNEKTTLKIFPLGLMDGTLKEYLKLNPEEAIQQAKAHIDWYKKYNGTFVLLWHNSSFNELEGWKNWDKVYENILICINE